MATPKKRTNPARKTRTNPSANLRERVLEDAKTLKLPLSAETLDAALARAEQKGLSHLNFLELVLGEPAARSRQCIAHQRADSGPGGSLPHGAPHLRHALPAAAGNRY
jgi:hypothetical protein